MKKEEPGDMDIITKELEDACVIEFGTRVVQKKDGGSIYPVYGGGGATFKVDTYNRENSLVVSRFAMSKECTRFVEGKFFLNDSGLTVRPKNEGELTQSYLDYLLRTLNDTIYSLSRGTAQRNLNVSKFRKLVIKYPNSTRTQLHIANLLSKAESLIAQRKESIRLLDEYLKSTFLEMFGDPVRNERGWEMKIFEGFTKRITKGESPKWQGFDYLESGVRFVTSENVLWGSLDLTKAKFIHEDFHKKLKRSQLLTNDLLVNLVGASVGRTSLCPKEALPANINQAVAAITLRFESINPIYVLHLFVNPSFQRLLLGNVVEAARANLSLSDLRNLRIPFPPIELQNKFAHIVERMESLKALYQKSMQELESLYGSLSQRAFRGGAECK